MEFDKALSDLFRLQVPEAELTHTWGVNHITAVREVIQPSGGRGVLTETRVVRNIVGQDLFCSPSNALSRLDLPTPDCPAKMLMRPVNASSSGFSPS